MVEPPSVVIIIKYRYKTAVIRASVQLPLGLFCSRCIGLPAGSTTSRSVLSNSQGSLQNTLDVVWAPVVFAVYAHAVNMSVHMIVHLSMHIYMHMSMHTPIHMSENTSMHTPIHMSKHTSIHTSLHTSIHMSIQTSTHKSLHMHTHSHTHVYVASAVCAAKRPK